MSDSDSSDWTSDEAPVRKAAAASAVRQGSPRARKKDYNPGFTIKTNAQKRDEKRQVVESGAQSDDCVRQAWRRRWWGARWPAHKATQS